MRADSVQKILEFCDEFVPGEPPEYFFDRLGQRYVEITHETPFSLVLRKKYFDCP
jgi:hypothetical protein